jgi:predicted nucleic acid-binding protein
MGRRPRLFSRGTRRKVAGVVIVDTAVWIDYLQGIRNPETDWVHAELDRQRLGLTDVILCEMLQGVRDELVAKDVERQLLKLALFETGSVDLAREAARNYRILRSRGHTVPKTIGHAYTSANSDPNAAS